MTLIKPGMSGRLRWAAKTRRRPRSALGWLRLVWHDFVIHALFEGGERCQDCGRGYPLWHAEGDLWERVHGTPGGLLCPSCFDRRAREIGVQIEFRAIHFCRPGIPFDALVNLTPRGDSER